MVKKKEEPFISLPIDLTKINNEGLLNLLNVNIKIIDGASDEENINTDIRNSLAIIMQIIRRLIRDNEWNTLLIGSMHKQLKKFDPPKTQEEIELDNWFENQIKELFEKQKEGQDVRIIINDNDKEE